MARFRPRARLGLRARITLAFGFGALLLSALLASLVWGLTRENLLNQRDRVAINRTLTNAVGIAKQLPSDTPMLQNLASVPQPEGSVNLIRTGGEWTGINPVAFGPDDVDAGLLELVDGGTAARMRYAIDDQPVLVVGVPVPSQDTRLDVVYFEAVPLNETEETLAGLGISLLGAAAVTTLAGFALGFYASGRTLRPLALVGQAAEAIADGELDTRLHAREDPDLRPLIESFNHMVTALQDRIERDARFASEVSHELRSPLMTLTASVEVLKNAHDELPERAQTALELLSHDIERFAQLVEDLLEISRFDAGAVRLELAPVLVAEMVEQAAARATPPVGVDVKPSAQSAAVMADKRRLAQVIANLIDNAQKYAGGATLIRVEADDDLVRIAVVDGGPGVAPEERSIIFDRFSRGSAGGRRIDDLGTGLGLALVKEHVLLHGGEVWVEDRRDGKPGARFVVQLPAVSIDDLLDDDELAIDPTPSEVP